jgi:2-keto-4-pentenoate hydratase/2-oxohepta-3-ene-1,7-dioic acid hydratase in catechol pathway
MKLALYDDFRLGVIKGDRVADAMSAVEGMSFRRPQDLIEEVIINWDVMRPRIEAAVEGQDGAPLGSVRLRPPVPRPPKLICAAVNYLEFGMREPAVLDAFLKSPTAVIGSGDTCELPPAPASVFHHEPELAFVIGRTASKVEQDEALSYIFGYTNFLDMSARGLQGAVGNSFFLGKCWDTFAPMGPALVTADEIADPQDLQVRLWNNDEPRHDFPTSDMAHKIPEMLEWMTWITAMEPGDVIACGTNHRGLGPLQDGETVEMEIGSFGKLTVKIADAMKREWVKETHAEREAREAAAS